MTQKTKVKELVGRSLNSYHTKSLQQIDRIEKKNKEQNHKISILSNELDNDYLTKTEEGSVVSLEHSKEGMVYLDELQGNTLVNYCTDGSKEITLNGDIDVEGTFVTTSEGVDNGKVDVMCEGNTLVNLHLSQLNLCNPNINTEFTTDDIVTKVCDQYAYNHITYDFSNLKPNTTYTCYLNVIENNVALIDGVILDYSIDVWAQGIFDSIYRYGLGETGEIIFTFITPSDINSKTQQKFLGTAYNSIVSKSTFKYKSMILEGDWTNKEIPQYFEDMKSVGQDDENGHKIEILSQNKNLLPVLNLAIDNEGYASRQSASWKNIKLKPNTKYTLSYTGKVTDNTNTHMWGIWVTEQVSKKPVTTNNIISCSQTEISGSFTTSSEGLYEVTLVPNNGDNVGSYLFKPNTVILEEGEKTSYIPYALNKKEILMNEPLRRLPNEVKDRIVKIGNKWYIERKLKQVTLNSGAIKSIYRSDANVDRVVLDINFFDNLSPTGWGASLKPMALFETINWKPHSDNIDNHWTWFHSSQNTFHIVCPKGTTLEQAIEKLDGCNVVYQIDVPIYEPLGVEPILNTYTDVTHISNSSVIPCNMKIQNTGYNAIIKPSTLYTVALDTNKSGAIGMNLGGAKRTTTNNVATITTPATLTDDSLRLYGKGIKGSKVRILEGDKTNWIPSFFEGMKSSFEDKFDATDNTYKMEILSNNENLLDLSQHSTDTPYTNQYKIENNTITGTYIGDNYTDFQLWFNLKRNKTYKLSWDAESSYILDGNNSQLLKGKLKGYNGDCVLNNNYDGSRGIISNVPYDGWYTLHFHSMRNNQFIKNLQLKEVNYSTDFVERKYNKIQFLLDEPLRKIDDILKDKFTFKDGKLMIERNCIEKTLDGSETWHNDGEVKNGYLCCYINNTTTNMSNYSKRTFKCNILPYEEAKRFNYEQATRSGAGFLEFILKVNTNAEFRQKISELRPTVIVGLAEPIYEEVPYELAKIILEGYENGTLFIDTNIPPTSTVTYAGETPIVKATKLNKTEVLNNTNDINDNIIPYLMDMDYRVVCLQLATEELEGGVSMARLFGGTYEMIKRDILSKRLTREEYGYRLADYYNAGKLTEEQVRELEDLR